MKRLLVPVSFLILLLSWELYAAPQARAQETPNIVFLITDDLDYDLIANNLGNPIDGTAFMPNLKAMADQGLTFTNYHVTFSLCCPSRATTLRGQYSHNTGVRGNAKPVGGFEIFFELGRESSTIATWLKDSGYQTALIGKYLNNYPGSVAGQTYVPPGWHEWRVHAHANDNRHFYNYVRVENGVRVSYGTAPGDYRTDVEAADAVRFIRTGDDRAFFLYLAPFAPHGPAIPARRHLELFPSIIAAPQPPSFNEEDMTDKPLWLREFEKLTAEELNLTAVSYRRRLASMMAVDDMIGAVVNELRAKGKLANTYIFFTSDNGWHHGHHRLDAGKTSAYQEDVRVPLIVTGPGVSHGQRAHLVLNNDLAPTFADIAGVTVPEFVDGRSFRSLLTSQPPPQESWRSSCLIEFVQGPQSGFVGPSYNALRSVMGENNITYVEYDAPGTGNENRELYYNDLDPYQLTNVYAEANPAFVQQLSEQLNALKTCSGASCRIAEDKPLPSDTQACTAIQTCVDESLPSFVAAYMAEQKACRRRDGDEFAITPGQLAARAVAEKKCAPKYTLTKSKCSRCYKSAKKLLKVQLEAGLFQDLLDHATSIIESDRQSVCGALPERNRRR